MYYPIGRSSRVGMYIVAIAILISIAIFVSDTFTTQAVSQTHSDNARMRSVELGIAELSPVGESGGYAMPASSCSCGSTCTYTKENGDVCTCNSCPAQADLDPDPIDKNGGTSGFWGPFGLSSTAQFEFVVRNVGDKSVSNSFASEVQIDFNGDCFDNDPRDDSCVDLAFATANIPSLGIGASHTLTPTWSPTQAGTFRARLITDIGDLVVESSGSNNDTYWEDFTITAPPPQCSDGVDNADPEDTIADYPSDPGCSSAADDDETDAPPPLVSDLYPEYIRYDGISIDGAKLKPQVAVNMQRSITNGGGLKSTNYRSWTTLQKDPGTGYTTVWMKTPDDLPGLDPGASYEISDVFTPGALTGSTPGKYRIRTTIFNVGGTSRITSDTDTPEWNDSLPMWNLAPDDWFYFTAETECTDGVNNDPAEDALIDAADPGCHTDGNASNAASYDPNDDSELDDISLNISTVSVSPVDGASILMNPPTTVQFTGTANVNGAPTPAGESWWGDVAIMYNQASCAVLGTPAKATVDYWQGAGGGAAWQSTPDGGTQDLSANVSSANLPVGTHCYTMVSDWDNFIDESPNSENNHSVWRSFTISVPAVAFDFAMTAPAQVTQGNTATIGWQTTAGDVRAGSCVASGGTTGWPGGKADPNNSWTSGVLNTLGIFTYTLTCNDDIDNSPETRFKDVEVIPSGGGGHSISVTGSEVVRSGDPVEICWDPDGAVCTLDGPELTGDPSVAGCQTIPVTNTSDFTLTCDGFSPETVTVLVTPGVQEP